jgi:cytoskeletal protein CcmA (bactofilin family)
MFSSIKGSSNQNNRIDTLIGTSTCIMGNIQANGLIKVDGKHTGDITTEADIVVGEGGYIKGDLRAVNITISGNLEGNVYCSGTLEILPTGSLSGDVEVANFSIEKGGIFNGKCNMINNEVKKLEAPSERNILG